MNPSRDLCNRATLQSQQSGGDLYLVAGKVEVLEQTGQVDEGAVWRHRSGQFNPPGSAMWLASYLAIRLNSYSAR